MSLERVQAALRKVGNEGSRGGRKLLKWDETQWKDYQKCPMFGSLVQKILPIRAPLSTLYEIHYASGFKGASPSDFMERLLEKAKRERAIDIALVIDATGDGYYYHEARFVLKKM